TRNAETLYGVRGFESHPVRQFRGLRSRFAFLIFSTLSFCFPALLLIRRALAASRLSRQRQGEHNNSKSRNVGFITTAESDGNNRRSGLITFLETIVLPGKIESLLRNRMRPQIRFNKRSGGSIDINNEARGSL